MPGIFILSLVVLPFWELKSKKRHALLIENVSFSVPLFKGRYRCYAIKFAPKEYGVNF